MHHHKRYDLEIVRRPERVESCGSRLQHHKRLYRTGLSGMQPVIAFSRFSTRRLWHA